jgi:hypothetical protein
MPLISSKYKIIIKQKYNEILLEISTWTAYAKTVVSKLYTWCPLSSADVSKLSLKEFICANDWGQVPSLPLLLTLPPTVTATTLHGFQSSNTSLLLYFN